jgi:YHS domain-containing protein
MNTFKAIAVCSLLAGAAALAVAGCKTHEAPSVATASSGVKPYPLQKCVVSGEAIEPAKAYTFVRDGQEIKLCCKDCLAEFDKDPQKYMAKINEAK